MRKCENETSRFEFFLFKTWKGGDHESEMRSHFRAVATLDQGVTTLENETWKWDRMSPTKFFCLNQSNQQKIVNCFRSPTWWPTMKSVANRPMLCTTGHCSHWNLQIRVTVVAPLTPFCWLLQFSEVTLVVTWTCLFRRQPTVTVGFVDKSQFLNSWFCTSVPTGVKF